MAILTLTSDWGLRDHYLASFKGQLLTNLPALHIVDISHDIEKFNTMQGAFVVQNAFHKFPSGTVHYIGISGNENSELKNPFVIIRTQNHYLVGEDTGIFSLILGDSEKEIVRLPFTGNMNRNELCNSIIDVLKRLSLGDDMHLMGTKETLIQESYFAQPTVDNQTIRGTIMYIDSFGNAIINVTKDIFCREVENRNFTIHFRKTNYNVTKISQAYDEVEVGEMVAIFNQDGYLEIALNKESAVKLLGLKLMDPIRIEFDDRTNG